MRITLNEAQRAALSAYFDDDFAATHGAQVVGDPDEFDVEVTPGGLVINGASLDDDGEWSL